MNVIWRVATVVVLAFACVAVRAQATRELLRQSVEYAQEDGDLRLGGVRLSAVSFLGRFYGARRFAPAWTDPVNVADALRILEASDEHGLTPRDFHVDQIRLLQAMAGEQPEDARIDATLDLLLTDGMVTFAFQLVYGKVDPHAMLASWNLMRPLLQQEPEQVLEQALAEQTLPAVTTLLMPDFPYYRAMLAQLKRYRYFTARGGWPPVPGGFTLKAGITHPNVATLRARLAVEYGDVANTESDSEFFGAGLEDMVRRYQEQHGLQADGVVGAATLRKLNVSAAQRVEQIRINLERARWLREEFTLARRFVLVNIPGFYLQLFDNGEKTWETLVIVGTEYDQTPVFAADMQYVVFNPTWAVPRSIVQEEMLPAIKADPAYLASGGYDLLDAAGRRVDPATVDLSHAAAGNFPYGLVQRPGRENALGRVKFILPNEHAVYLHDTPARQLFGRAGRAFSHGCVRTDNPLELAALLLADQTEWTRTEIDRTVASGVTRTVFLSEPMRVLFLYWTAEPAANGGVRFFEDVYDRDGPLGKALDAPFRTLTPADR